MFLSVIGPNGHSIPLFQPQNSLPDIFIWMMSGGKRVAYARINAQHVIYSQTDYERGRDAGRCQTVFLRVRNKSYDSVGVEGNETVGFRLYILRSTS